MTHIYGILSILDLLRQITRVLNKYECLLVLIAPNTLFLAVSNIMEWHWMSLSWILLIYEICLTKFSVKGVLHGESLITYPQKIYLIWRDICQESIFWKYYSYSREVNLCRVLFLPICVSLSSWVDDISI